VITPGSGDDIVDGRGGSDTVSYAVAEAGMTIDLAAGQSVQQASGAAPRISFTTTPWLLRRDDAGGGSGRSQPYFHRHTNRYRECYRVELRRPHHLGLRARTA
jgi:hypothetical protein